MPTMPVFGTIEFDIDPITARWFDAWMESGGPSRRLGPGAEIAAMRELTLVERLNDPRPKFLRQMEEERERAERLAAERAATEALEAARLAAERDEAEREAEQLRLEVEAAEREAERLRVEREEAEREAERLELQRIALEKERSETEAQSPVPNGTIDGSPMNSNIQIEDIDLSADEGPGLKGLSSPINLGHNSQPVSPGMLSPTSPHSVNDYRASGMIMADQLTTLEKSELRKFDRLTNSQWCATCRQRRAGSPSARLRRRPRVDRGRHRLPCPTYLLADRAACHILRAATSRPTRRDLFRRRSLRRSALRHGRRCRSSRSSRPSRLVCRSTSTTRPCRRRRSRHLACSRRRPHTARSRLASIDQSHRHRRSVRRDPRHRT